MNNHFHMIIEAVGEQLSECMYHVGRAYAVWYNRESGRTGPVFDGRFGSQPITDDTMLMVEGRYVHRNPVDIVGLDGLVNYRFSSLGVYAGLRPRPNWLSTDVLAGPFSDAEAFVRYVRRTLASDTQYSGRRPPLVRTRLQDLDQAVQSVTGVTWAALRSSPEAPRTMLDSSLSRSPPSFVSARAPSLLVGSSSHPSEQSETARQRVGC